MAAVPSKRTDPSPKAPFFQPNRIQRFSDPEFAEAREKMMERIRNEPGYGQKLLQNAGIVNAKGKLTKPYRD